MSNLKGNSILKKKLWIFAPQRHLDMKIAIDIGNSTCKIGIFDGKELKSKKIFSYQEEESAFLDFLQTITDSRAIISNVGALTEKARNQINLLKNALFFNSETPIPILNRYASPQTLGSDRLCAAIGGVYRFPGSALLLIDTGTCITYDLVNPSGHFLGGSISPGLRIRFEALHQYTQSLPLINYRSIGFLTGTNTEESILSGVVNGIVFEMNGFIQSYEEEHPALKVILTGGNAHYFVDKLKKPIFAEEDLVLIGLNEVLDYHRK